MGGVTATESLRASYRDGFVVTLAAERARGRPVGHHYLAYGVPLHSELELWARALPSTAEAGQGEILISCVAALDPAPLTPLGWVQSVRFDWPGLAAILVEHGQRIWVAAAPDADPRELAAAVAGPGLATALGQRALLALHGTCVAFGASAVCLLGESGAGKSTLAAALCAAGGALVSDTMTVVDLERDHPCVRLGPAQLKLWPDAARTFGYDLDALPMAVPGSDKRICPFFGDIAAPSVRLEHLFLLVADGPVRAERVGPAAAVVGLLQNHFLTAYLGDAERAHWLSACARVVESTHVYVLRRGVSLTDLDETVRTVRAELKSAVGDRA